MSNLYPISLIFLDNRYTSRKKLGEINCFKKIN
jgi:hypothetical protein